MEANNIQAMEKTLMNCNGFLSKIIQHGVEGEIDGRHVAVAASDMADEIDEVLKGLRSEDAGRPIDGMTFGMAIEAMKHGAKVARKGWNGKGMYLWLLPAAEVKKEWCRDPRLIEAMGDRETLPCLGSIRMFTATREVLTGWLASQTDMLAEDWVIVE